MVEAGEGCENGDGTRSASVREGNGELAQETCSEAGTGVSEVDCWVADVEAAIPSLWVGGELRRGAISCGWR